MSNWRNRLHLFLILIASLAQVTRCRFDSMKTVETRHGTLLGTVVSPAAPDMAPVVQFLGVPYGQIRPPGVRPGQSSNDRRFAASETASRWAADQVKEAVALAAVCPQQTPMFRSKADAMGDMPEARFDAVQRLQPYLRRQTEDCLTMNLYVPERLGGGDSVRKLPILVLVHGDEYDWNSGNPYNGTLLASYGEIIVITVNYRLGVFGFLSACASPTDCHGNWALYDLTVALTAIRMLAPSVDGDPSRVTMLGWGSGAALVQLLTASPFSSPSGGGRLFQRAVLLGGSALSPWAMVDQPMVYFYQLAENIGCSLYKKDAPKKKTKDDLMGTTEIVNKCLREHSVQNLTAAARKIKVPTFLSAFGPSVDGKIIPSHPKHNLVQHGNLFREIDLLVGLTSNEAYHLLNNKDLQMGIEPQKRTNIFRTLVRNLYDYHRKEIYDSIINEYTDWSNPGDHPKAIRKEVLDALGDALYVAPAMKAARLHADGVDGGAPNGVNAKTFFYVFAHERRHGHRGGFGSGSGAGVQGALRGDDLPYLLGYPLWQLGGAKEQLLYDNFGVNDREISKVMMRYLSNYVKTGNPNQPIPLSNANQIESRYANLEWPKFSEGTREAYMEFTDRPQIKMYYRASRVAFWNRFLPALQGKGTDHDKLSEEHHLLPNYAGKQFFGIVRPFGGYANLPFPPPPIPPSPPPTGATSMTPTAPKVTPSESGPEGKKSIAPGGYSTVLAVTVSVGCALLVLNILIFVGIYHQRDKQMRNKDKMQMNYQSYDAAAAAQAAGGHQHGSQHHHSNSYNMHQSPQTMSMMPPAPPPPVGSSPGRSTPVLLMDNESIHHQQQQTPPPNATLRSFNQQQHATLPNSFPAHQHHHHIAAVGHNNNNGGATVAGGGATIRPSYGGTDLTASRYAEHEPLLGGGGGASTTTAVMAGGGGNGGAARPGISPTCPRHGRAALAAIQHQHSGGTVEEIQV